MAFAVDSADASAMMKNHCLCSGETVEFAVVEIGAAAVVEDVLDVSSEKNSKTH